MPVWRLPRAIFWPEPRAKRLTLMPSSRSIPAYWLGVCASESHTEVKGTRSPLPPVDENKACSEVPVAYSATEIKHARLVRFEREPNNGQVLSNIFVSFTQTLMGRFRDGMAVTGDAVIPDIDRHRSHQNNP